MGYGYLGFMIILVIVALLGFGLYTTGDREEKDNLEVFNKELMLARQIPTCLNGEINLRVIHPNTTKNLPKGVGPRLVLFGEDLALKEGLAGITIGLSENGGGVVVKNWGKVIGTCPAPGR